MSLPIADVAESFINAEADDLYAIAQEYVTAIKTGRMGNRNIAPGQAKQFASDFRERADALYLIAPLLKAHLAPTPPRTPARMKELWYEISNRRSAVRLARRIPDRRALVMGTSTPANGAAYGGSGAFAGRSCGVLVALHSRLRSVTSDDGRYTLPTSGADDGIA